MTPDTRTRGLRCAPFGHPASPGHPVPQSSAGWSSRAAASGFRADASEIRQLEGSIASRGGTPCAAPAEAVRVSWHTASTQRVMPQSALPLPCRWRFAASVERVRTLWPRRVRAPSACFCTVDTPRPSANFRNRKTRVISRGSASLGSSPKAHGRRPEAKVRSRYGPQRTRTGTPMRVVATLQRSCSLPFYPDSAHALHSSSKTCSHGGRQLMTDRLRGALALRNELRHGSCLLVHVMAAPIRGGVNEEMAA